ncbi:MAG TPA: glycosyltransferase [Gemmatimonadota bacterium]|nr:glycosyltransferase [Gemmatimonadota bacterium]
MTLPFVSVVIPVFHHAARLESCLESLEGQTYPGDRYEVIVVNNGREGEIERLVERFGRTQVGHELRPSQFAARNRGLELARGDVIAFIDADCIARPDWMEQGVARLAAADIVAGRIDIFSRDQGRPTAVELYDMLTNLDQRTYVRAGRFGATANLFVRRAVFDTVGSFDPVTRSGGDVEWGQRAVAQGFALDYADEARVDHPARESWWELSAMVRRRIGGVHDLRERACTFLGIDRGILGGMIPPVRYSLALSRDPRLGTVGERAKVVIVAFAVRYLEAAERLRLRLGGQSRR